MVSLSNHDMGDSKAVKSYFVYIPKCLMPL